MVLGPAGRGVIQLKQLVQFQFVVEFIVFQFKQQFFIQFLKFIVELIIQLVQLQQFVLVQQQFIFRW